jgi:predicted transcriptional regulator
MVIKGSNVSYEVQRKWDAELTPEAWHRYNELETQMLESGMNSQHPEVMTPVGDRLSKSILKAAVLVAAAEQKREDGKVIVEMVHLLRAIAYGEQWKVYSREVIQNIGKSTQEKIYDQMVMFINKHPGISRSRLMQNYRLNAREMSLILETLEQRGQIIRQARGRGEVMFPSSISVSPKELNNGK